MKLRCIRSRSNTSFQDEYCIAVGKWYHTTQCYKHNVDVIIDYEKWHEATVKVAGAIDWIRRGYTQDNLHEVIPGYLGRQEIKKRYCKTVELDYYSVRCNDGEINTFIGNSKAEFINKYGDKALVTLTFLEDYFETEEQIRDNKLNNLIN